jgi:protein TonB
VHGRITGVERAHDSGYDLKVSVTKETAVESRSSPVLLFAAAGSVVVHVMLVAIPIVFDQRSGASTTVVSFSVVRTPKPQPPVPPPRAIQLPRPQRSSYPSKAVKRPRRPSNKSVEPEARRDPEPQAPPVFGADTRSMTSGESSISVPEGNTVATDPSNRGPVLGEHRAAPPTQQKRPNPRVISRKMRKRPSLIKEHRIPYPLKARSLGIEGTVRVSLLIGEDGRVKEAKVLSGPGFGLNRAAIKALLRFRFHPAIATDGRPMAYRIVYRYTFQID